MIVISSREFRDHQKKYFDLIDDNEQVIVQRGKNKSYKLVPIMQDESLMTEAEFYAKIESDPIGHWPQNSQRFSYLKLQIGNLSLSMIILLTSSLKPRTRCRL